MGNINISLLLSFFSFCFGSGAILKIYQFQKQQREKEKERIESLQLGVQALLRDKLLQTYKTAKKAHYADLDTRSNFENLWEQYHNLGANGVMNNIHDKFQAINVLPPEELKQEGKNEQI